MNNRYMLFAIAFLFVSAGHLFGAAQEVEVDEIDFLFRVQDLSRAVIDGNLTEVQKILDEGVDPNQAFDGKTPLTNAAINGHADVVEALLPHTNEGQRAIAADQAFRYNKQRIFDRIRYYNPHQTAPGKR